MAAGLGLYRSSIQRAVKVISADGYIDIDTSARS